LFHRRDAEAQRQDSPFFFRSAFRRLGGENIFLRLCIDNSIGRTQSRRVLTVLVFMWTVHDPFGRPSRGVRKNSVLSRPAGLSLANNSSITKVGSGIISYNSAITKVGSGTISYNSSITKVGSGKLFYNSSISNQGNWENGQKPRFSNLNTET